MCRYLCRTKNESGTAFAIFYIEGAAGHQKDGLCFTLGDRHSASISVGEGQVILSREGYHWRLEWIEQKARSRALDTVKTR